ncbi:MAG: class I SAM-dependent methyltransferase [Gammaproteobacteria bacterium]|jgi:caffeoyl-CoA O-methyltransferase|nr:class I SAM-dependent methyltransferase [Gammaproteobacteria bacterium]
MSNRTIVMNDPLYEYLLGASLRDLPLLKRLREETAKHPRAQMQISPEQGQFMQLLTKLMGARRCIEVGVFTGYSSLCVALALPADGRILACDVSEEFTSVARRYWKEAAVEQKIELKLAPALETLDGRLKAGEAGSYDLAFIDADKSNYSGYYERILKLLRPGGLVLVDNVLWDGAVIDKADKSADTVAIRAFNEALLRDERVDISLLPVGDGLTLARKR